MKFFKTLILFAALFSCKEIKSQCLDSIKVIGNDSITFYIYTNAANDTCNLTIYNRWGAVVKKVLLDSVLQPGYHTIVYHPSALASGIYVYQFKSRGCTHNGNISYLAPASIYRYAADKITISPNPCTGIFTIGTEFALISGIQIYNTLGAIVYQDLALTSGFKIDVSFLPNGIYFVYIISNGNRILRKLIINS
jgi:hypothetical protein